MRITKSELKSKYGIDLPSGKFNVENDGSNYIVSTVNDDTDGCILIGRGCNTQGVQTISGSVLAYTEIYPMIAEQIEAGYPVNIEVI